MGELDLSQSTAAVAFASQESFLTAALTGVKEGNNLRVSHCAARNARERGQRKSERDTGQVGTAHVWGREKIIQEKGDFIFCFHWKKKCRANCKIQNIQEKTAITEEIRKRKVSPWVNFLYFLETLSLNLSYMLFAFIIFPVTLVCSHNIRVKQRSKCMSLKMCAMWVISCAMAYGFYGITHCVISFLFWYWIFTFAAFHKISSLSCTLPDGLGGLPRVKRFSRVGWQPSLLISIKLQWFMALFTAAIVSRSIRHGPGPHSTLPEK